MSSATSGLIGPDHFDSRTHYFSEAAKRRSRCGSVRGIPNAKLTFLSRLGATRGATNHKGVFLVCLHSEIMQGSSATTWSIVISRQLHFG
jgi:hypothetical protein